MVCSKERVRIFYASVCHNTILFWAMLKSARMMALGVLNELDPNSEQYKKLESEVPELRELTTGHRVACHYPMDVSSSASASGNDFIS